MLDIQKFNYQSQNILVIVNNVGEIFFDAAHICRVLDYKNPSKTLQRLDEDEKCLLGRDFFDHNSELGSKGGAQKKWFVTEPGLYFLILGSEKKEAKIFKRWVVHEVLPAIRKTGKYFVSSETGTSLSLISKEFEAALVILDLQVFCLAKKIKPRINTNSHQ